MVKNCVTSAGFALLLCIAVAAGAEKRETYTLRHLEDRAVERAPSVLAATQNTEAADAAHDRSRYIGSPEVFARHRYYPESGTVTDEGTSTSQWATVGIEQNILETLTVRPVEKRAARAARRAAEARLEDREQTALYRLRKLYCAAALHRRSIDIQARLKKVRGRIANLLERRRKAGGALRSELLEAKHAKQKSVDQKRHHRQKLESLRAQLAETVKLRPRRIKLDPEATNHALPAVQMLKQEARRDHPKVRRKRKLARESDTLAEKAGYEDMRLRIYGGYHARIDQSSETETGPMLGISFSMPLYVSSMASADARRRRAKSAQMLMEASVEARQLSTEISDTYEEYQYYRDRLETIETLLAAKRQKLKEATTRTNEPVAGISADPLVPLRTRAEIYELQQEKQNLLLEKNRAYYTLLYLSGMSRSDLRESLVRKTGRGLWAWDIEKITGNDDAEQHFASFCAGHAFDRVHLGLGREARKDFKVGELLEKLTAQDVDASCLLAGTRWVLPQERHNLLEAVDGVLAYNAEAPPERRFSALHLDLEPHTLPKWDGQKEKLLSMLSDCLETVRSRLDDRAPGLALAVDIPHFYDSVSRKQTRRIVEAADRVVLMAYGTASSRKYRRRVKDELAMAAGQGTDIRLGLKADEWPTLKRLEEFEAELLERIGSTDVVRGTALHDYTDYRELLQKDAP